MLVVGVVWFESCMVGRYCTIGGTFELAFSLVKLKKPFISTKNGSFIEHCDALLRLGLLEIQSDGLLRCLS